MASMCGMVDFSGGKAYFPALRALGRAMMREGEHGTAYLSGGVGLWFNDGGDKPLFPLSRSRETGNCTILLDGVLRPKIDAWEGIFPRTGGASWLPTVEAMLGAYCQRGIPFFTRLGGEYAFAICDEARNVVLLGRDEMGKRPLYYAFAKNRLYFLSDTSRTLSVGFTELPAGGCHLFSIAGHETLKKL